MAWEPIADSAVAEYAPITARLMRRLRDRLVAAAPVITRPPFALSGSTSSTTYAPLFSMDVYVPGRAVGPTGTRFGIYCGAGYTSGHSPPPTPLGRVRVEASTVDGSGQTVTPAAPFTGWLYCDVPGLAVGIVELALAGNVADAADTIDAAGSMISLEGY